MRVGSTRLRALLAGLLIVSATLFAVGATLERHQHAENAGGTTAAGTHHESPSESSGKSSGESSSAQHSETETKLLGINTESVGLEITAILLSLGLAVAALLLRQSLVLVAVIVFGLAFAAGDVRELAHQLESRPGLATIAAVLIGLHLAVAAVAAVLAIRRTPDQAAIRQPTS
jgi:hypothetical protein